MSGRSRLVRFCLRWLFLLFILWARGETTGVSAAVQTPALFDMGTAESPVMPGFQRVTADEVYNPSRSYGFLEPGGRSFFLKPVQKGPTFMINTVEHFKRHGTPLLIDGVRDTADIRFRADVPPGRYRITVSLGDLNTPMGCVSLYANGQLVEENITFHHGTKRRISGVAREWTWGSGVTGFYDRVRFTIDAPDGTIVIRLTRDESTYNRLLEIEKKKEPKFAQLWKSKGQANEAPYIDIGEPFVDLPLLGVEIRPYFEPPVAMIGHGELRYSGIAPALAEAAKAFNDGRKCKQGNKDGSDQGKSKQRRTELFRELCPVAGAIEPSVTIDTHGLPTQAKAPIGGSPPVAVPATGKPADLRKSATSNGGAPAERLP